MMAGRGGGGRGGICLVEAPNTVYILFVPEFRWNEWNVEHIAKHGIHPADAEYVVEHARSPYPEYKGDERWLVRGQTESGLYLQVVFLIDPPEEGEIEQTLFIIHSRPLNGVEKRQLRRRRR